MQECGECQDNRAEAESNPFADISVQWDKCGVAIDAIDFAYDAATVPPSALFVAADEPLLVFPSVAAAERYLEAIDVENGVYPAAYGPNGELYRINRKLAA